MSYQALYRKYRPSTLEDVIGQDIIIKILKNAINNNKVCHAYMFSGPRGIGKTSIAKILAKTVNCLELDDGVACGKCVNCLSCNDSNPDIIEIDAASNNGVDEIREIKSKINLVPSLLKYKVYIIDEVHMLSIGAFNALLKTLEEPPEHVIFILATTDLHKVPVTIVSRCQCLEFHRINSSDITKRLKYICTQENIIVADEVLDRIAELSDGGMRDAVGMLDKLNAYSNSNITLADFEKVNGIVSYNEKKQFLDYIMCGDISNVIKFLDHIYDNGKDFIIFIKDIIDLCKNISISFYINDEEIYDIEMLLLLLKKLNSLLNNLEFSSNIKTTLTIELLSFVNSNVLKKNTLILNDNNYQKENKIVMEECNNDKENMKESDKIISREIISEPKTNNINSNYRDIVDVIINNCFARANKKDKRDFENNWSLLNDYALDSEFGAVASYLSDGIICAVGEVEVIISFSYESMVDRGIANLEKIEKLLEKIYNKHYDIALITNEKWNYEKKLFIENKSKNICYEYKDYALIKNSSEKNDNTDNSIAKDAIELFGKDMISIS